VQWGAVLSALKFIKGSPPPLPVGRKPGRWQAIQAELMANPGVWADLTSVAKQRRVRAGLLRRAGFEVWHDERRPSFFVRWPEQAPAGAKPDANGSTRALQQPKAVAAQYAAGGGR
jgi:hypothetical protein